MVMQFLASPGHHQRDMNMYQLLYEYVWICVIQAFPLDILPNMMMLYECWHLTHFGLKTPYIFIYVGQHWIM